MQGVLDGLAAHASVPVAALQGLRAWAADQAVTFSPLACAAAPGQGGRSPWRLHLDNVLLWQGRVTAFDCIEFDPALRWIDALSDAAFFTMDLAAHDRGDLAWRFLNAYLDAGGDHAGFAGVAAPTGLSRTDSRPGGSTACPANACGSRAAIGARPPWPGPAMGGLDGGFHSSAASHHPWGVGFR